MVSSSILVFMEFGSNHRANTLQYWCFMRIYEQKKFISSKPNRSIIFSNGTFQNARGYLKRMISHSGCKSIIRAFGLMELNAYKRIWMFMFNLIKIPLIVESSDSISVLRIYAIEFWSQHLAKSELFKLSLNHTYLMERGVQISQWEYRVFVSHLAEGNSALASSSAYVVAHFEFLRLQTFSFECIIQNSCFLMFSKMDISLELAHVSGY